MKLLNLLTIALIMICTVQANASFKRYFENAKWPSDKSIHTQSFTNLAAASTAAMLNDEGGNTTSTAVTVSSFIAQPDSPRNIVITPGGTAADMAACTVTVTGTDFFGATLTETFVTTLNSTAAVTGNKAFKTVSSVAFPAGCEDSPYGVTWDFGYGEKIGLNRCMDNAGDILFSLIDGAKEATAPTMAANATSVSANTADFNGTMDGTADFVLYFFHNYRCNP